MIDNIYPTNTYEFQIISRTEIDNCVTYDLKPIDDARFCPQCFSDDFTQHGTAVRQARDLNEFGKMVGLVIHGHRYKCGMCGKTWTDQYKAIDSDTKMTNRMMANESGQLEYICKKELNMNSNHCRLFGYQHLVSLIHYYITLMMITVLFLKKMKLSFLECTIQT